MTCSHGNVQPRFHFCTGGQCFQLAELYGDVLPRSESCSGMDGARTTAERCMLKGRARTGVCYAMAGVGLRDERIR